MFKKPFKVKSNNQLKGTERKKLCEEVLEAFPSLKLDEVQNLLHKKDVISVMKVVTSSGQVGRVYCSAKTPVFFQFDNSIPKLYPTIFTLWHYPDLLYSFTMHPGIMNNISNGADLMLPGVITSNPRTIKSYGKLEKGELVSVNTSDNKAPIAIGLTARSSEDMYMSNGHGKCVEIIHAIGDTLFQLDTSIVRPKLDEPIIESIQSESVTNETTSNEMQQEIENITEDVDNFIIQKENEDNDELPEVLNEIKTKEEVEEDEEEKEPERNPVEEMDKLLLYCFLKACKTSIKSSDLPILSSNLFKNYVLTACPPGQNVDLKMSSYKKMSVFLNFLQSEGVIDTSTIKGVQSIVSVKNNHPLIKNLEISDEEIENQDNSEGPVIVECYKVTTNVLPILSKFGHSKGDILKRAEIRRCFHEYVKKEGLQNGSIFNLNGPLAGLFQTNESVMKMKMEDGINKFIGKMTIMREITTDGTTMLHTGKLEPIDITVSTRCNYKKVTLINNLEMYGIKLEKFSKECQEIGASATLTEVPGKKTPSVLVQGNQVLHVYKLLTEKYRLNKRYIRGLEFAPKKRK